MRTRNADSSLQSYLILKKEEKEKGKEHKEEGWQGKEVEGEIVEAGEGEELLFWY